MKTTFAKFTATALAAVLAAGLLGSTAAQARGHGGYHGYHGGYRHHHGNNGAALAVGLGILGIAILAGQSHERDRDRYEDRRYYTDAPPPPPPDDRYDDRRGYEDDDE